MRLLKATILVLMISVPCLAQTPLTPTGITFEQTTALQDPFGNLVVFDFGAVITTTTVTNRNGTTQVVVTRFPKTRITVVRGQETDTVTYDGSMQIVGVGTRAIYALLDTTNSGLTTVTTTPGTATFNTGGFGAPPFAGSGTTTPTPSTSPITRTLIAIQTNLALPATTSSFPSFPVTTTQQVRMTSPDQFSILDPLINTTTTPATVTTRSVTLAEFNGSDFVIVVQSSIP